MMMAVGVPIEPGHCPGMASFGNHAKPHQHIEYPVHRRPRDARDPRNNILINLVSRRMVISTQQSFQNGPPLNGHW